MTEVLGLLFAIADAATPPPGDSGGILQWFANNPFAVTLTLLVLATLLGSIISRMVRDRCMKDFEGYPVTLELKDSRIFHGELDVERTGLEFFYEKTTPQEEITKTSFLIYQAEYGTIQALVRYHDVLNEDQLKARERAAHKAYHPGFFRRTMRATRNFLAGIKDSIVEAFGLVLGRMKSVQGAAPIMQTGGTYVDRMGKEVIGTAANITYDPLLEKQIGLRVVVQFTDGGGVLRECVGTFREYTKDFFDLLEVDYESKWDVALAAIGSATFARGLAVQWTPEGIHIENCNTFPVDLTALTMESAPAEAAETPAVPEVVPKKLESGAKIEFDAPAGATGVKMAFHTRRKGDLLVPRAGAFIRHKSEWVEPRKFIGALKDAVGLLPGTHEVFAALADKKKKIAAGSKDDSGRS